MMKYLRAEAGRNHGAAAAASFHTGMRKKIDVWKKSVYYCMSNKI